MEASHSSISIASISRTFAWHRVREQDRQAWFKVFTTVILMEQARIQPHTAEGAPPLLYATGSEPAPCTAAQNGTAQAAVSLWMTAQRSVCIQITPYYTCIVHCRGVLRLSPVIPRRVEIMLNEIAVLDASVKSRLSSCL